MTRIIIYEDNTQLREGLVLLINAATGFEVVASFANCTTVVDDLLRFEPDIVLMDIDMPFISGIEGLKAIRSRGLTTKVLMLTVFDDSKSVFESIKAGANGYLLKKTDPDRLIESLQDTMEGGSPMTSSIATQVLQMVATQPKPGVEQFNLSQRELDVLNLIVEGYSYKMIADKLFIAMDTVRSHIRKIYEKLEVNSKSEAVAKALKGR